MLLPLDAGATCVRGEPLIAMFRTIVLACALSVVS